MMRNWANAKTRRTSDLNATIEKRYNPLVSRQKEISVMIKDQTEAKFD
jgi:hypothetical protein